MLKGTFSYRYTYQFQCQHRLYLLPRNKIPSKEGLGDVNVLGRFVAGTAMSYAGLGDIGST